MHNPHSEALQVCINYMDKILSKIIIYVYMDYINISHIIYYFSIYYINKGDGSI